MSKQILDRGAMQGILEEGFGAVARKVMRDQRLSIGAKGLYSYLVCFAGAGMAAWPKKSTICKELGIHQETYNKYLAQLIDLDYIRVEARRGEGGKFLGNLYTVVSVPTSSPDGGKNRIPEKSEYGKKPDAEKNHIHNNNNKPLKNNNTKIQQQQIKDLNIHNVVCDEKQTIIEFCKNQRLDSLIALVEDEKYLEQLIKASGGNIKAITDALYASWQYSAANDITNIKGLVLGAIQKNFRPSPKVGKAFEKEKREERFKHLYAT